jgi:hypothetical protein
MRRFVNGLAVLVVVLSLSVPASAAPRRDDGAGDFFPSAIKRIVQLIKRAIHPLDGGDMSFPKP